MHASKAQEGDSKRWSHVKQQVYQPLSASHLPLLLLSLELTNMHCRYH